MFSSLIELGFKREAPSSLEIFGICLIGVFSNVSSKFLPESFPLIEKFSFRSLCMQVSQEPNCVGCEHGLDFTIATRMFAGLEAAGMKTEHTLLLKVHVTRK